MQPVRTVRVPTVTTTTAAACVRPAHIRWDTRAPLSLENCFVTEMKEFGCAMRNVFAVSEEGAPHKAGAPYSNGRLQYVDALVKIRSIVKLCSL